MPGASKATASGSAEVEGDERHLEPLGGGDTVVFEGYSQDADLAPFFRGLPGDRCQCPPWGHVIEGRATYRFADGRQETYESGDANHAPPGNAPVIQAGTRRIELSATDELMRTREVVSRNTDSSGG